MRKLSRKLSSPPYDDLGEDEGLAPILAWEGRSTLEDWQQQRGDLRERWNEVLGRPSFGDFDKNPEVILDYHIND